MECELFYAHYITTPVLLLDINSMALLLLVTAVQLGC